MADDAVTGDFEFTRGTPTPRRVLAGTVNVSGDAATLLRQAAAGPTKVSLQRSAALPTEDQALWSAIRNRTDAIGFNRYSAFIHRVLCEGTDEGARACGAAEPHAGSLGSPSIDEKRKDLLNRPGIYGVDAYQLLKLATQAFLLFESGVVIKPARFSRTGLYEVLTDPNDPAGGTQVIDGTVDEVRGEASRSGEPVTFAEVQERLEQYLAREIGTVGGRALPYLKRIVNALVGQEARAERLPYCEALLHSRLNCPSLIELIWSYWHEEGMLVQTMNTITLRFQNRRRGAHDPLANLEMDPLRPLNNLLWGFVQDETNRLTVMRRAYEYDHHYGLNLYGKAVSELSSADSRSKFIEAFHNLLHRTAIFYQEDADTTVISDGFPLLNGLKDVHTILAEGAHNQFGDLPWTARVEMLVMQWLLARLETREFLRGRAMVPYREPWMGQVDTMKRLQGWTDVSINHFRDLGVFGEQIVLSIRYGDWIDVNDQEQARNWARYWKPEVQSYIHSYLAATGVDLAADVTDTRRASDRYLKPSVHLRNRLAAQRNAGELPAASDSGELLPAEARDYARPRAGARALKGMDDDV
jgi:hypothetical protein